LSSHTAQATISDKNISRSEAEAEAEAEAEEDADEEDEEEDEEEDRHKNEWKRGFPRSGLCSKTTRFWFCFGACESQGSTGVRV
jgi:uncharacterized membrane protein YdbT with pleckstrin-like domain